MSNYLEVPRQRRDSYKSDTWDFIAREKANSENNGETSALHKAAEDEVSSEKKKVEGYSSGNDFCTKLFKEAPYISGDAGDLVTFEEIPWIDQSLIQQSDAFHKKYYAFEIFSMISAIIFGFALKSTSAVHRSTSRAEQFINSEDCYERQISTIHRILKFFDFRKSPDEAYDEVLKIRKMHSDAAASIKGLECASEEDYKNRADFKLLEEPWKKAMVQAMQKDLEFIDNSEETLSRDALSWVSPLPVSQFDMVFNQLGLWMHMWLYPRLFGIKNKAEEMKGIIHVWAIFGRLVGIKDEYNICLVKPETVAADDDDVYEKVYRSVLLKSLKNIDESVITIQNAFMTAFSKRVPVVTYKAVIYFGLQECKGYRGDHLWKVMGWKDIASVRFLQGLFFLMRHSKYFRMTANYTLYIWFKLQFLLYMPYKKWRAHIPRYLKNAIKLKLY